eukprot:2394093-Pyramimonas_sp.AAC.1
MEPHAHPANGALGGVPYGPWATKRVRECAEIEVEPHADLATGAFDGVPCRATKRVRGVPKLGLNRMRALPMQPSV